MIDGASDAEELIEEGLVTSKQNPMNPKKIIDKLPKTRAVIKKKPSGRN